MGFEVLVIVPHTSFLSPRECSTTAGLLINSLCYLVSGIAIFVVAFSGRVGASNGIIAVLAGIAACGCGLNVLLSRVVTGWESSPTSFR